MPRTVPPFRFSGFVRGVGLIVAAAAGGCFTTETHSRYPQDLYHPDYVKRSKAVARFAEEKDRSQMPDAFQLLLDDDANIRLVAYDTIREMSPGGEDFGYRPYLSQDVRYGIVVRWQTWWVRNGEGKGEASVEPTVVETVPEEAEGAAGEGKDG